MMDKSAIEKTLSRLVEEIYEGYIKDKGKRIKDKGGDRLLIIGIKRRGEPLAVRIAKALEAKGVQVLVGSLDITLYRDDLTSIDKKPIVRKTEIPFSIENEYLLLVDDVLYTGRTIRAALTELVDFGRPKKVQLAVLIDRKERELPICPDFVGKTIMVGKDEKVDVKLEEIDKQECVEISSRM